MTKVWSVYFPKGGVGKTTLAFNMARYYALKGLRVLAIGLDDQRSLTRALAQNPLEENTDDLFLACHFALKGKKGLLFDTFQNTDLEGLKFIPEANSLRSLYTLIRDQYGVNFLKDVFVPLVQDDFDIILFDCPPAQSNPLVQAALWASDLVLLPYSCQVSAVSSWQTNFDELVDFITTNNPSASIKVVANNSNATKNSKEALDFLEQNFSQWVVGEPILSRAEIETALKHKVSVQEITPQSINAKRIEDIFLALFQE